MYRRFTLDDAHAAQLRDDNRLEYLIVGPQPIPFIELKDMPIGSQWEPMPKLAKWSERGNTIIVYRDQRELKLIEVQLDPQTGMLLSPN